MSKAGKQMIAAAKELLESLRNDNWSEHRTPNGTLVFTSKPVARSTHGDSIIPDDVGI